MLVISRSIYPLSQFLIQFSRRGFSVASALRGRSASQSQWIQRQTNDFFTKEAKLRNYKSRAAFKLLEMDKKYRLFKPGMTVVDLGFAPGAWSQVAVEKTSPNGKVVGVDILFAPPPEGVTAVQGNFLTKSVQEEVRKIVCSPETGRRIPKGRILIPGEEDEEVERREPVTVDSTERSIDGEEIHRRDLEMRMAQTVLDLEHGNELNDIDSEDLGPSHVAKYNVDIVLSDMCAPLDQNSGFWLRSVNDPYFRMANTSGLGVRDHGASIVSNELFRSDKHNQLTRTFATQHWCLQSKI
jgi:21S rRNA (uridine2791-2'-O)-methyltransferase